MNGFFSFRFFEEGESSRYSLGVYISSSFSLDELLNTIKVDVSENFVPKKVFLMTLEGSENEVKNVLESDSFSNEFEALVGPEPEKLEVLVVKGDGEFYDLGHNKVSGGLRKSILSMGMMDVFRRRKGIISSSSSYHFSKPSGDHCNKFIRASNLLVSSTEVSFLALSIIPYLRDNIKRIYIDTSSIAYLMLVSAQLSDAVDPSEVVIESFESYAALKEPYDFVEDRNSIVVISATTSGSLAKKILMERGFANDQVITLFYLDLPSGQIGLFDVKDAISGGVMSVAPGQCSMCKAESKVIRISGDQFLPETPKNELLVIRKPDFSKEREDFFGEFARRRILRWNESPQAKSSKLEHFFIDVEKAVETIGEKVKDDLDKSKNRYLSRHVDTILALDCPGSIKLAGYLSAESGLEVHKYPGFDFSKVGEMGSVLVVAGSITSGRKLLSVSRRLRGLSRDCVVTYYVGFSKLPTKESEEQLKKDLVMGGNEFYILRRCPMPRIKEYTKTAWDFEKELFQLDPFSDQSYSIPYELSSRVEAEANDELFLRTPLGEKLSLRDTFAFWSDINFSGPVNDASQADVYWTIQSVLHDLRLRSSDKGLASTYHTTLVSPFCFDRYNDGVIQACFLRGAKPIELNYSIDENYSRQMTDILVSVISSWQSSQGEAALEFLFALACGRLNIIEKHKTEVCDLLSNEMPETMKYFLQVIRNAS